MVSSLSTLPIKVMLIFNNIYSSLEMKEGELEPMMNILCWYSDNRWIVAIFARSKHRPSHYFAEGEQNILLALHLWIWVVCLLLRWRRTIIR